MKHCSFSIAPFLGNIQLDRIQYLNDNINSNSDRAIIVISYYLILVLTLYINNYINLNLIMRYGKLTIWLDETPKNPITCLRGKLWDPSFDIIFVRSIYQHSPTLSWYPQNIGSTFKLLLNTPFNDCIRRLGTCLYFYTLSAFTRLYGPLNISKVIRTL